MTADENERRVRVVVGDDQPVFRYGVTRTLQTSGRVEVVAETSDGRAALEAIQQFAPDVALLDYRMPDLDVRAIVRTVARDGLSTRVLILSAFDDSETIYQALSDGVAGFLTKKSSRREIVAGVLNCAKGQTVLPECSATGLAEEIKKQGQMDALYLSVRELQVINLIAAGHSAPQIANELGLGVSTIKTHMQRLYGKLGVSDRGAAVAVAMRLRLLA